MAKGEPFEVWHATITRSILGPVVPSVRRHGRKEILARDAPQYVRQFLNLPDKRNVRPLLQGFTWEEARAFKAEHDTKLTGGTLKVTLSKYYVHITFAVRNPEYRPPRPRLTVAEHGPLIRNFAELLDYFDAGEPQQLSRRIYKDTACGASISLLLHPKTVAAFPVREEWANIDCPNEECGRHWGGGHGLEVCPDCKTPVPADRKVVRPFDEDRWLHNGAWGWEHLTRASKVEGFTIQTIVEGSDATVDSDLFRLPCTQAEVRFWMADMEAQATELWEQANVDQDQEEA